MSYRPHLSLTALLYATSEYVACCDAIAFDVPSIACANEPSPLANIIRPPRRLALSLTHFTLIILHVLSAVMTCATLSAVAAPYEAYPPSYLCIPSSTVTAFSTAVLTSSLLFI